VSTSADYDRVAEAAAEVRRLAPAPPEVALVLGSGLGGFARRVQGAVSVPYASLPHWPVSGVVGHEGRLVLGVVGSRAVAVASGRVHAYEGHDLKTVTFPIRVLALAGVRVLVLTNAAGGINPSFSQGALMAIDDHINLTGLNPLSGPNDERFGPRFPDMSEVYSRRLRRAADAAAAALGTSLMHGVYVGLAGPSYETPAEIRFLRTIGVDAVGMSTVPEAIVARHMGVEVVGLSCITNMAAGILPQPLVHEEVMATAARVRELFEALLEGLLGRI
jgi:purine-nucleoside phosphorylase